MPLVDFSSLSTVLRTLYRPSAQDFVMANIRDVFNRPKVVQPNDAAWPDDRWLMWFLRNHGHEPLIAAGLWKKPAFIVADLRDDQNTAAVRAAYALDGEHGAWPVLIECLMARMPEGWVRPELPEGWDERVRYYAERWEHPNRPPLYGRWLKDNGR